jgi:RNA polymerase sigma-70 factor (ECF subfamily)
VTAVVDFDTLVTRARDGDSNAMTELVRRYEPEVRTVARLRLGPALRPHLDTMDLVQSVHRSLLIGLRDKRFAFNGPQDLIALAVTMVRRKAARHWQRLQRQVRPDGGDSNANLPAMLMELAAPDPEPGRTVAIKDTVEQLCRSLDALEVQLIEMGMQGYKTAEIARRLNLNADVLRVKLSRLRIRLRSNGIAADWL